MARVYYSDADVGRNTFANTTYQDQSVVTFTPNASKVYVILWGCLLDNDSTTNDSRARLYHDTAAAALETFNYEAQDTTDNYQVTGAAIYTAPGSPTSQTFKVQYSSESTNTTGCQDAWIVALELHANDLQSVTAAEQTLASSAFGDIGPSVTCAAGNWLLIASAEINCSAANISNNWQIHDGTSQITVTGDAYLQDATNYTPWWQVVRVQPGSSTTYKLRFKSSGGAVTVRSRNTSLIALDLSQFSDVIYGDSLGESTTLSASAQTKLSVTDTPVAAAYLQLFACSRRHDSTANSGYTDYTRGGAAISVEAEREPNDATNEYIDHGYGAVSTLTASSTTWLVRYRSESSTTRIKNAAFAALQLGDAPTTSFQGGMIRAGGVIPTTM
jgi:hypothetical protein